MLGSVPVRLRDLEFSHFCPRPLRIIAIGSLFSLLGTVCTLRSLQNEPEYPTMCWSAEDRGTLASHSGQNSSKALLVCYCTVSIKLCFSGDYSRSLTSITLSTGGGEKKKGKKGVISTLDEKTSALTKALDSDSGVAGGDFLSSDFLTVNDRWCLSQVEEKDEL